MGTATFERMHDGSGLLRFPYNADLIEDLKFQIPSFARRWDAEQRAWIIGPDHLRKAKDVVSHYYSVRIIGTEPPPRAKSYWDEPPPKAKPKPQSEWADVLYARCPDHLRDPVFKALARALHADTGGDGRMMQELNDRFRNSRK